MDLSDQVKMENEPMPNNAVKQVPEGQDALQPARGINDISARLRTLEFKMRELQEMQENMQKVQQWISSQRADLNRQIQQLKQQQLVQRQGHDGKQNPADVKVQRPRGVRGGKNKRRDPIGPYKRETCVFAEYLAKKAIIDAAMGSAIEAISKQAEGRQR